MYSWAFVYVVLTSLAVEANCTCSHGIPANATNLINSTNATFCSASVNSSIEDCSSCDEYYHLSAPAELGNQICLENVCKCAYGTPVNNSKCQFHDRTDCEKCDNENYTRQSAAFEGYPTTHFCAPYCDLESVDLCELAAKALPSYYNNSLDNYSYAHDCLSLFPDGRCSECQEFDFNTTCRNTNCQEQPYCPPNFDIINGSGNFDNAACVYTNYSSNWPHANATFSNALCYRKCSLFRFQPVTDKSDPRAATYNCTTCVKGFVGPYCTECPRDAYNQTCSGHGTCKAWNVTDAMCECDPGYFGKICDKTRELCHDRGDPVLDENDKLVACICGPDPGWDSNTNCSDCISTEPREWVLLNTTFVDRSPIFCAFCAANGSTCNYHGTCGDNTTFNACMCDVGYTGEHCERCDYFHYPQDVDTPTCTPCLSTDKCGGHGTCNPLNGSCICDFPFAGSNGTCNACVDGYWGPSCTMCPGLSSNTSSCMGRGLCDDDFAGDGTCACNPGFAGSACQFSSAQACNNHGSVYASPLDSIIGCTCDTGFAPPNCQACLPDYYGPTCKRCGPETCSGTGEYFATGSKGRCQIDGSCLCDEKYAGANCETCAPGLFDYPRCVVCNASTCSNHGSCIADATCTCVSGWAGPYCDDCAVGFYGPTCTACQCNGSQCLSGVAQTGTCLCDSPFRGPRCQDPTIVFALPLRAQTSGGVSIRLIGYYLLGTPTVTVVGRTNNRTCTGAVAIPSPECPTCSEVSCVLPAMDPNTNGQVLIVLSTGSGSASLLYDLHPPIVTGISFVGAANTTGVSVTLNGVNFGEYATVNWNRAAAVNVLANHTSLVFSAPAGTGNVPVSVLVGNQLSPAYWFTYAAPIVRGLTSLVASTAGGDDLTITGSNFGTSGADTGVRVGQLNCSVLAVIQGRIICDLPASYGEQDVVVTVSGQKSVSPAFFAYGAPTITSVSGCTNVGSTTVNCSQTATTVVTVSGSNFGSAAAALGRSGPLTVTVDGVICSGVNVIIAHTRLSCSLPAGGFGRNVSVTVSRTLLSGNIQAATANSLSFQGPTLTASTLTASLSSVVTNATYYSVNVPNTLGGQTVTITGSGFGTVIGNVIVHFFASADPNSANLGSSSFFTNCAVTAVTVAQITCTLAAGVGQNLVFQVSVSGLRSDISKDTLSHPVPTATTVNGGSSVSVSTNDFILTLAGSNFGGSSFLHQIAVTYGPASDKSLYECVPQPGTTDSSLQCRYGGGALAGMMFRIWVGAFNSATSVEPSLTLNGYTSPMITSMTLPPECVSGLCPTDAYSRELTLAFTVSNLVGIPTVRLGPVDCTEPQMNTSGRFTCRIPNYSGKNYSVSVRRGVLRSSELFSISYQDPVITTVSGACIDGLGAYNCSGGDIISITGSNFGPAQDLMALIQGVPCSNVNKLSESSLTCVLPALSARAPSAVMVMQQSGELSNAILINLYSGCNTGSFYNLNTDACSGCPAGTYQPERGQSSCVPCAFGSYSLSSSSACTACAPGRFNGNPSLPCQNAPAGTYCPKYGMASCLACPPGTYSASDGAVECTPCSAYKGEYSTGTNRTSCSVCPLGKVSGNGQTTCVACSPGRYTFNTNAQNSWVGGPLTTCNPCLVGTFYNATLLPSFPCQNCTAGRYNSVPGALECTLCQYGTYGTALGASSCPACPVGKFGRSVGAIRCADCQAGKFADQIGQSECFECPVNTWSNMSANIGGCWNCPVGQETIGTGRTSCQACPVGKAVAGGGKRCAFCEPGKFANRTGMSFCIPAALHFSTSNAAGSTFQTACPLGTQATKLGSISCTDCLVGTFNNRSGIGCQLCAPGTYMPSLRGVSCLKCPPGFHTYQWGQEACIPCGPGKYSTVNGTSDCVACVRGKAQPLSGQTTCNACVNGSTSYRDGSTKCFQCPPGQEPGPTNQTCIQCQPGKYRVGWHLEGISNMSRMMLGSDTGFCQTCPPGRISTTLSATTCAECGTGNFCGPKPGEIWNGKDELPCEPGTYSSDLGASVCLDCEPGKFGYFGQLTCKVCPAGSFQSKPGQSRCENCPAKGGFGNAYFPTEPPSNRTEDRTACFPTRPGYRLFDKYWHFCPPGTDSSPDPNRLTCSPCIAGKYTPGDFEDGCQACPRGKTQPATGQVECIPCSVGRYNSGGTGNVTSWRGSSFCYACDPGTYAANIGATTCLACEAGKHAPKVGDGSEVGRGTGIVACRLCVPGKFMKGTGSKAPVCDDCPAGRYQSAYGATECIECAPGSASDRLGATSCNLCLALKYSDEPGSSACLPCKNFTHWTNPSNRTYCEPCQPGYVLGGPTGDKCIECQPGEYGPGDAECQLCEAGRKTSEKGQSECEDCPAGSISKLLLGSTNCTDCETGKYSSEPRSSLCIPCKAGSYGVPNNRTFCPLCEPGKFSENPAQLVCINCEPGKFAPDSNSSECTKCPVGRFQSEEGASTGCGICDVGTFAGGLGQTGCEECVLGTIAPNRETKECSKCAFGVPANVQRTVCLCPKGYYVDPNLILINNEVDCKPCPMGADCSSNGTLSCRDESITCQKQGVRTMSGYWRGDGMAFFRCLLPEHCCGGNGTFNCCNQNRGGFLCASCLPGTSANSILGACEACPDEGQAVAVTVVIVIVIFIAAVIMYYILLRADAALIRAMEEADKQALEWDQYQSALHYETRREFARSVSMKSLQHKQSIAGDNQGQKTKSKKKGYGYDFSEQRDYDYKDAPVSIPGQRQDVNYQNYTYKIKIIVGFLQINNSTVFQLKVPWPRIYQTFINFFSIVNLDFVPWQNLSCVTPYTFYDKYLALTILPVTAFLFFCGSFVIFVKIWNFYLVSRKSVQGETVGAQEEKEAGERKVTRTIRKFWKLALFTIFLAFPGVCTKTLSYFLCLQNDDKYFLYADVNVQCYDATWDSYLGWAIVCVFMYPVGIPLGFLGVLLYYRKRFSEPGVKLQTGFLYDAYAPGLWWFELIDVAHKLFMTSILAFVDRYSQMPVGMAVLGLYLILIIVIKPYMRTTDDTLHLTCQMELLMLCLVGYRLTNQSLEPLAEFGSQGIADFTGVLLIAMTVIVLLIFVIFTVKTVRLLVFSWLAKRRTRLRRQSTMRGSSFILQRGASFRGSGPSADEDSDSSMVMDVGQPVLGVYGPSDSINAAENDLTDIAKAAEVEKSYLSPLFAAQLQEVSTPSATKNPINFPFHSPPVSPKSPRSVRHRGDTVVLPPPSDPSDTSDPSDPSTFKNSALAQSEASPSNRDVSSQP